jgi:bifunctional enzyme CysN/CysC
VATTAIDTPLLRLATAGSVDDGKSTLIGRLLYDSKSILADQLAQVEEASRRRGGDGLDLSLLTDGLRAEREQGITIDVAYRYFATPARTFVIADTPGHVQYTRNMVTGASTADLAVILVDARKGVLEQSKRHAFISSLLGIRHLVVAVNKMDLVGFSEDVFDAIVTDFSCFARNLGAHEATFIPISALHGDNVVERSEAMEWYAGPALLEHLERVEVAGEHEGGALRFPVQWVIRDGASDYRGYAGQVAGGVLKKGDDVMVLPSGFTSKIASVETADGEVDEAFPPMSVTIRLEDQIDVSRGDMICRPNNAPNVAQDIDAMICWMDESQALEQGRKYTIKHTTRSARTVVKNLHYRLDVNSLHRDESATSLALNEIGRVRLRTTVPLLADEYRRNRTTGGLIVIDEATNRTVAAGIIIEAS